MFDKDSLQQLYRYCYSLTCNEHNAYDLLQGALEKFLNSDVKAKQPMAYIKRVIHNKFVDDLRRQKIVHFDSLEETELPADFDVQTLENILINEDMVEQVLQFLEADEREILYFWAIEGFSTSEIALQLEKPKGTILSKIYRMRKKLHEKFNDNSDEVLETKA